MPKRVTIPGVGTVNFPDDMPDDQVHAEAEKLYVQAQPKGDQPKLMASHESAAAPAAPTDSWSDLPGNILPSAGRFVANAAEGLYGAARSGLKNAQAVMLPTPENIQTAASDPVAQGLGHAVMHPIDTAKAVGSYAMDRYGGLDKAKHTLITDPVGAASDAATVLSMGGALAENAPGMLGKVGRAAAATGEAIDPGLALTRVAGKAVGTVAPTVARTLNASALKPSKALRDANKGVDIPLETAKAGAVVSRGGAERFGTKVDAMENRIGQAVDDSAGFVMPSRAAANLEDLMKQKIAQERIFPGEGAAVRDRLESFVGDNAPMTPREAQNLKVALGKRLANRFGSAAEPPVSVEAQQALRVGLKDELTKAVPEIAGLNRQLGPMYAVQDAVNEAVARTANHNIIKPRMLWGASAGGALGGLASGPVGGVLGAVVPLIADSPYAKSVLAKYLYRGGQAAGDLGQSGQLATRAALLQMMGGDQPPQP
jgi:hypothetical protein